MDRNDTPNFHIGLENQIYLVRRKAKSEVFFSQVFIRFTANRCQTMNSIGRFIWPIQKQELDSSK